MPKPKNNPASEPGTMCRVTLEASLTRQQAEDILPLLPQILQEAGKAWISDLPVLTVSCLVPYRHSDFENIINRGREHSVFIKRGGTDA